MSAVLNSRGLGDSIARITKFLGVPPCGGCERRRETLNRWIPYRRSRSPGIQVVGNSIVLASAGGGSREPDGRDGPLDWEGDRRHERSTGGKPAPSLAGVLTPFACGIDVTESTKGSIRTTKSEFSKWTSDQKHKACTALHSFMTGDIAWDILELHAQVTDDVLNKSYRPPCATSGATPACGSSVTIGGSCHFAGSANYVIFGIMCKLCFEYYQAMQNSASWYELIDKNTYNQGLLQFGLPGTLGLIDLYKKYVPLLSADAPARNIDAAKRWAIAGWNGWPYRAPTPEPDRANCRLTCPHKAPLPFTVSWYPLLNPYARRRGVR